MEITIKVEGNPWSAVTGLFAITVLLEANVFSSISTRTARNAHAPAMFRFSRSYEIFLPRGSLLWVAPPPVPQYNGEKWTSLRVWRSYRLLTPHLPWPSDVPFTILCQSFRHARIIAVRWSRCGSADTAGLMWRIAAIFREGNRTKLCINK